MSEHTNSEVTSEITRTAIFSKNQDNNAVYSLMEAFKLHGMEKIFNNTLPGHLNCAYEKHRYLLFWKTTVLTIKDPLTHDMVTKHFIDRQNLAFKKSKNKAQTELLIAEGLRYIEEREEDIIRRDAWRQFGKIQNPRYYIIHTINQIAAELAQQPTSDSLIEHYRNFYLFAQMVQNRSNLYFPKTRSETGFRNYLQTVIEIIERMANETEFWLERQSLSDHLRDLSQNFTNYIDDVAIAMVFCISPSKLSTHLSAEHIRSHHRTLSENTLASPFFKLVSAALKGEEISTIGISTKDIATSINAKHHELLRTHFLSLAEILKYMQSSSTIYADIANAALEHGEGIFVRNLKLKAILEANLEVLDIYLKKSNRLFKEIIDINIETTRGLSYEKGYTQNAEHAKKLFNNSQAYLQQIKQGIQRTHQQVTKLLAKNDPDIESTATHLVERTLENISKPQAATTLSIEFKEVMQNFKNSIGGDFSEVDRPTASDINVEIIKLQFPDAYHLLNNSPSSLNRFIEYLKLIQHEKEKQQNYLLDLITILKLSQSLNHLLKQQKHYDSRFVTQHLRQLEHKLAVFGPGLQLDQIQAIDFVKRYQTSITPFLEKIRIIFTSSCDEPSFQPDPALTKAMVNTANTLRNVKSSIGQYQSEIHSLTQALKSNSVPKTTSLLQHFKHSLGARESLSAPTFNRELNPFAQTPQSLPGFKHYEELHSLLPQLLSTQDNQSIKLYLYNLCMLLNNKQYKLYGGGEKIIHNNTEIKVPRHIKQMLDIFAAALAAPEANFQLVRHQMFKRAIFACEHPPVYLCGLFNARDKQTQTLYDTLMDQYKAYYSV